MTDWARIAKLAAMLGGTDGEAVNAARLIGKALAAEGLTWGDLANRISGTTTRKPFDGGFYAQTREWTRRAYEDEEKARQRAAKQRGEW